MDDQLMLRYSRQIMLPEVDLEGQERLAECSVLVIGLGGLGSPVSMYLAAAGVGRLVLVDHDVVELSNLQRQIVHSTADLKRPKVESARDRLQALNPHVTIETIAAKLTDADFDRLLPGIDVVVDCTDNFTTRFAINHACVRHRKPLVSGAAVRFEAQVSVFRTDREDGPCYRCLYSNEGGAGDATCAANGVIAPLLGIVGGIQALETLKVLLGIGEDLTGRVLLLDALSMEWHSMRLKPDPRCPECGALRAMGAQASA